MGHLMFYLAVVAACLLWSATFVAAAARTERVWLRRLLVAVAIILPPLALAPWVGLTAVFAFVPKFHTNWFGPTLTACLSAAVGGLLIRAAGMATKDAGGRLVAASWPVVGLAAMFVLAKAVAFGTLMFIDNAVAAEGRALRVEAAQLMAATMPPVPATDDDAAPLYLRAFAGLAADKTLGEQDSPAANPATTDIAAPEVAAILDRHGDTLDLLRRAADKPGCRFVRDWSRPSVAMLLPEIQEMRRAGRLLVLAARRAAADGKAAAALEDVVRIHRIGQHAAAEPILVCGLVGQALDAMALETLAAVLPTLRKADLPLLDAPAFRDFVATPFSYQRHFFGEEAFGLATMADLADGRVDLSFLTMLQSMDAQVFPEPVASLPLALLFRTFLLPADMAGYRAHMSRYQQLAARMAGPPLKPFSEIEKQADAFVGEKDPRRLGMITGLMAPALTSVLKSQAKSQALHRAAEVLVAATRDRLAGGSLPESAAALVPGRLAAVPLDPFTADQPLLAKQTDGYWTVYSVGPDGEDDGGPAAPGAEAKPGNDDIGLRLAL